MLPQRRPRRIALHLLVAVDRLAPLCARQLRLPVPSVFPHCPRLLTFPGRPGRLAVRGRERHRGPALWDAGRSDRPPPYDPLVAPRRGRSSGRPRLLVFASQRRARRSPLRPHFSSRERALPGDRHRPGISADAAFAGFLALHFLFSMAFWQLHAGLPIDMARHGVSPAAFGSVLAVNTILVALLQPFAHRLTGRLAPTRALAAGSLLVGLGYGGYALCSTAPQYALATGILTLGEIVYLPVAGVVVADLAPPQSRGRYAGAFGLSFGLAGFLAPIAGPALMQASGAPALWMACLLACAGVAAGQLALGRARRGAVPEQRPA